MLIRILIVLACSLLFSTAFAQDGAPAEGVSTTEIAQTTLGGVSSCLRWRLRGGCGWLRCTPFGCNFRVTLRVEHFMPDTTISTWHDAAQHPWRDYGTRVARSLNGAGSSLTSMITGIPGLVDSAGTRSPSPGAGKGPQRAGHNLQFRGADVIGNPFNMFAYILSGSSGMSEPDSIPIPTPIELMRFYTTAAQQVYAQWSTVPSTYTTGQTNYATEMMGSYGSLLQSGQSAVGGYQEMSGNMTGGTGEVGQGSSSGSSSPSSGGMGMEVACPPGVMPFGLLFHSELDSWFWRGLIPLESIFPATWLPGMREVGQGVAQTWGNVWPRTGALFQQNPVKASAVIAQRAGDIVSYGAQPHIYSPLNLTPGGFRWFGSQVIREHDENQTIWQRVYPQPETTCRRFGYDDSVAPVGFGDGVNVPAQGFVWNAWRRQECCAVLSGYAYVGSVAL